MQSCFPIRESVMANGISRDRPFRSQRACHIFPWLALTCLMTAGCGSDNDLARVTGKVTLNGQPLENATVEFRPATDGAAPSSGTTDAKGRYELRYTFDTPGAIPGEHIVSVRTAGTYFDEQGNERERQELVPSQYNVQTELKRVVDAGRNTIDLEL